MDEEPGGLISNRERVIKQFLIQKLILMNCMGSYRLKTSGTDTKIIEDFGINESSMYCSINHNTAI